MDFDADFEFYSELEEELGPEVEVIFSPDGKISDTVQQDMDGKETEPRCVCRPSAVCAFCMRREGKL